MIEKYVIENIREEMHNNGLYNVSANLIKKLFEICWAEIKNNREWEDLNPIKTTKALLSYEIVGVMRLGLDKNCYNEYIKNKLMENDRVEEMFNSRAEVEELLNMEKVTENLKENGLEIIKTKEEDKEAEYLVINNLQRCLRRVEREWSEEIPF